MRSMIKPIVFSTSAFFLTTSLIEPTSAAVISRSFQTPSGIFEIIEPDIGESQGVLAGTYRAEDINGDGFITVELRSGDQFLPSFNELIEFELTSSNFGAFDTILGLVRGLDFTLSSAQGNFVLGFRQEISTGQIFQFEFTEGFPTNSRRGFRLDSLGLSVGVGNTIFTAVAFSPVFNSSNPIQTVPEPFTIIGLVTFFGIGSNLKKKHSKQLEKSKLKFT